MTDRIAARSNPRIEFLASRHKIALRRELPPCQGGTNCPNLARIDCKSWRGPWGYFCARCWPMEAMRAGRLGTGIGQYLMTFKENDKDIPSWLS